MSPFANTPQPPYYAVIFTSQRAGERDGYEEMANRMDELAAQQPGFLGAESVRGADGFGITVSYWESTEAITRWKIHAEHLVAQHLGRERWYRGFELRVCRVERAHSFCAADATPHEGDDLRSTINDGRRVRTAHHVLRQ